MTYEEFLQLTEKNLKQYFPESFQERKVEIREVLKNNNIKLQGVYLSGSPSYTSVPLLYLESYYQELENGKKLEDVWQNIARDYQKCQETAITIDGISSKEWDYETIKKGLTVYVRNAQKMLIFLQIVLMKYVRIWHWFMDFMCWWTEKRTEVPLSIMTG